MPFSYQWLSQNCDYDGTQLRELFPRTSAGVKGDGAVVFSGKCDVNLSHLVDSDDVAQNAPIYSESMLHFILEFFHIDLLSTIFLQRIFISLAHDIILASGTKVNRYGDDIYLDNKKLSVSIATASRVSTLIHCGFNLSTLNTPVATASLADLGFNDYQKFANQLLANFKAEYESCLAARCKVFGV